jgi:tetratricopeptide (TPR) repeat protein
MKFKSILFFGLLTILGYSHTAKAQSDSLWNDVQKIHLTQADSAIQLVYYRLRTKVRKDDFVNLSLGHGWIGTSFMKINMDSSLTHATICLKYAEKAAQPILYARAYHLFGSIDNRASKFNQAIQHFQNGLNALKPERDTLDKGYIQIYELLLRGTSTSYNYMNKNDLAMSYGLKALNYAQKHELDHPELAGLIAISSLFFKVENMAEARKYMEEALKKSLEQGNTLAASKCYTNLAIYCSSEKKFEEAEAYQMKGIELNQSISNYDGLSNNYVSLGMIKFETGREKEAITHFLEAEKISKEKKFELQLFDILANLSMAYNRQNRNAEALAKAEELLVFAKQKNRPDKLARGYKLKHDALYGLGKYKESVEYLGKSIALSDSLKAVESENNLQQLLVKYETEKKEDEIKRITSEAEVKDLLLRQREIQLISGAVGVLGLIILAFLLFRSYRIKNEFELLDLQQRFYRAQINPHFLFNALGSVQGFFYDKTDPNKAAGYLARLSKLMRQILENTFDNEVTLAEEITLMENYLEIQKVRLGNKFDYEIRMDDDLRDVVIPSMITQPFLENSVEHGFKELTNRKGEIIVTISEANNAVQIKIEDNGTGLAYKHEPSNHKSRAMEITRERLRLLEKIKKKSANFEVLDNSKTGNEGVTVLINLPI